MRASVHGLATILALVLVGCGEPPAPDVDTRATTYDPEGLRGALDVIETWHRDHHTGTASRLRPGRDPAEIDALFAEVGLVIPRELRDVWAWRDGHDDADDRAWFVWYHRLLPVEDALSHWRSLRADPYVNWSPRWLPVLHFEGEWLFVDCGPERRDAGPVMLYFPENGITPAYASLTACMRTTAQALREGAVHVDHDGDLHEDLRSLAAIHAETNPGVAFPYAVD